MSRDAGSHGNLGVRHVLEGSVRRTGEQVRVNVQLIDAESGAHLWADRFDTNRADLDQAQDEITSRLAHTLNREPWWPRSARSSAASRSVPMPGIS
jgi:TolB-like protein